MLPSTPAKVLLITLIPYTILHQVSIKHELCPKNFESLVSDPHRERAWSYLHYIAESVYHVIMW